ncbi:unnamed protein product [Heterosigma akashiwo]
MNALTFVSRAIRPATAASLRATAVRAQVPAIRSFSKGSEEVVEPELFGSLEWTLSAPAPFHQFDESPIIVEVEHLG